MHELTGGSDSVSLTGSKPKSENRNAGNNAAVVTDFQLLTTVSQVLAETSRCDTDRAVAHVCLNAVVRLFGCSFGFIAEAGQDNVPDALAFCHSEPRDKSAADSETISSCVPELLSGSWWQTVQTGRSFLRNGLLNESESWSHTVDLPEDCPRLDSILCVPLRRGEVVAGAMFLANKDGGFDERDVHAVELLSASFVEVIFNKRTETELKTHRDQLEATAAARTAELQERVKELNCQNQVSRILSDDALDFDEAVQKVADLIPAAWQYPDSACARITLNQQSFSSANFRETEWVQAADFRFTSTLAGRVEVFYTKALPEADEGPFLAEERSLIDVLANDLELFVVGRKVRTILDGQAERFNRILESIPEILYVTDPDTYKVLFTNSAYTNLLGRNTRGMKCYEAFQGLNEPCEFCTNDIIRKQKGKPYVWQHFNEKLGRYYQVTDRLIDWPDGREVRFEMAIDITDLHEAEKQLRESNEALERSRAQLDTIIKHNADALVVTDAQGIVTFANPAAERIFQKSGSELLDRKIPLPNFKVGHFECPHTTADGTEIHLGVNVVKTDWDGCEAYLASLRDITDYKRMMNRVREREELLSKVINAATDAIITVGEDGLVRLFNAAAARLFKRRPEEMIGQSLESLMPVHFREQHLRHVRSYLADSATEHTCGKAVELPALRSDGEIVPIEITLSEGRDQCGGFTVVVARDITDRKQAERERKHVSERLEGANRELETANIELRRMDQLKSDFLSAASHELRTPLTIIKEFVSLVRDGITGPLNEEQEEYLDSALKNCTRLANLLNDVLDLQKIQSGKVKLRRKKTNIRDVIDRCIEDFQPQSQKANLELHLEISDDLPAVLCDAEKVTQVLVNLIGNALKFTPSGGNINVRAYQSKQQNNIVWVHVQDDGPGIGYEDQQRLFESFVQLDRQPGPGARGTGLGLTIAKNIVEMHNGQIRLWSAPGKGSDFSFSLPCHTEVEELHAFVKDRLSMAVASDMQLLLVAVRPAVSDESAHDLFFSIEETTSGILRRRDSGLMVLEEQGVLVIASEATPANSRPLLDRIVRNIRHAAKGHGDVSTSSTLLADEGEVAEKLLALYDDLNCDRESVGETKRVLVIDDEESILRLIKRALEALPIDVEVECSNEGYAGCLRFGSFRPHLLILDSLMPGFDGSQVLNEVKRRGDWRNTKVIAISGEQGRLDNLLSAGADGCLHKPLDIKRFMQMANDLLTDSGTA